MKKLGYYIFLALFIGSCNASRQASTLKKALHNATAQQIVGGVKGSGQSMSFKLAFFNVPNIQADTLWVNDVALVADVNQVGDTTYVASFIHIEDNASEKPLINDVQYSGKLQYYLGGKKHFLLIESFKKREPLFMQ